MHLETTREQFEYLANRFETKKNNATQREALCNPRTPVSTHQKHSEDARKLQERETTVKERENATVEESRNVRCRERKRDTRDRGRVEKRDRRGKRAARKTSEQEAAAREPGEEATDEPTRSVTLAVTPSSQDDDSRDMGVPCTRVTPQEPQSMSPVANDAAADAVNPNATSAGPPEPAGTSHELRDEPHESTGSYPGSKGENDDSRGPGTHCTHVTAQRPQAATGEASTDATNPNATSVGPPEPMGASREPQDEVADGVSLARPASSPHEEPAASAPPSVPLEGGARERDRQATNVTRDGACTKQGLVSPASSPDQPGVATPMDNTTNASASETATPPSILLEGEHDSQQRTNSACTGQLHGANAHGEGPSAWGERHARCTTNSGPRVPNGIVEDPGERTEPGTSGSPRACCSRGSSYQAVALTTGPPRECAECGRKISKRTGYAATYLNCPHCARNAQSDPPNAPIHPVDVDNSSREIPGQLDTI
ncbi:hypothetical protein BU15DRAFT_80020 [Melanogaster broomeanus]|nr:hypothetical protein BU15DRAFT_80020 [Melanogaster broomeanus]